MELIIFLVKEGYKEKEASGLIKSGRVLVNDVPERMVYYKVKEKDIIKVKKKSPWVSRGAYKLLKAIDFFKLNFEAKTILDIGSSTGGFTQVSLKKGAKKVYALDCGRNQLDYKLRVNEKVICMEKTNIKELNKKILPEKIDIAICDVSFISINRVFDVLENFLSPQKEFVALIKPQYQAKSCLVSNKGYVRKEYHKEIIEKVKTYANEKRFKFIGICESPLTGKVSNNIEYIAYFRRKNE